MPAHRTPREIPSLEYPLRNAPYEARFSFRTCLHSQYLGTNGQALRPPERRLPTIGQFGCRSVTVLLLARLGIAQMLGHQINSIGPNPTGKAWRHRTQLFDGIDPGR